MEPHRILKDFRGSHDNINAILFREGKIEPLSQSLAAIVVPLGWAEPVTQIPVEAGAGAPDARETKVIVPETPKPLKLRKK